MANPTKLLASAAIAAGLLGGGVVGLVLGGPRRIRSPDHDRPHAAPGSGSGPTPNW